MSKATTGSCPAARKALNKVSSLIVGAKCQAKACMVTDLSECSRRYGSSAKTKILEGVVLESISMTNPTTNRTANYVRARYDLGGGHLKDVTLHIRSVEVVSERVRANPPVAVPLPVPPPVTAPAVAPALSPPTSVAAATPPPTPAGTLPPTPAPPTAPSVAQSPTIPVVTSHKVDWFIDDEAVLEQIGQPTPRRAWSIKSPIGDVLQAGSNADNRRTKMDVFLLAFPPESLVSICRNTNVVLENIGRPTTTVGELLKFFGVIILATRFEFESRASLWSDTSTSPFIPAPAFGKTGMKRRRFDDIWSCLPWGDQPSERPERMSSEQYRWLLVDDFVEQFNEHMAQAFVPSEHICVDESISRWYGEGGHWINMGLPCYVAIDRKPENGCEIQNAACGQSGIMLRLKLVKTAAEESTTTQVHDEHLLHGTNVLKFLVSPWSFSGRIVCADSYFASVGAAEELKRNG
ncbi:transposase IS4 [Nitzschia inconspicua]|uniref:Transposase IS4 n=1 Tax=Nitzschia inconspicua TaxID=303405 RepID=A0A9K3PFM8_9STRA|nr:transposase IS4 [Nitzschia inconspicua]